MNFKLLSAGILLGAALASQPALAADGTINFTGQIQANTCTINGNGTGSNNFTVALPSALTGQLGALNATAGRTSFQIALTGCPSATNVHTFYEAGATTDASSGRLNNTAVGGATNVQIQLLNSDGSLIKAGFSDSATQQNSKSVALNAGAATLTYYAEYFATGAAGAGAVTSNVAYTIVYN